MSPFPWLALNLSAIYLVLGIFSPYWGVWLESVGLPSEKIGLLLGFGYAMRLCGSLVILRNVKRAELLIPAARFMIFGGLLCFAGFYLPSEFWFIFFFTLAANFIYPTLLPLTDTIAARMVLQVNLDYGKVRLWGSAAFIVGAMLIGQVIEHLGPSWILHCVVIGLLVAGFCIQIPMSPAPRAIGQEMEGMGYFQVLKNPHFLVFIAVESLIFGSHAAYNSFSAIYWKSVGISAPTISSLWTIGVIFEIVIFALSRRLFSKWTPEALMLAAAIGCVVRWTTLGATTNLWVLFPAQSLHSITYVLAHLGAMRFMAERLPREALIAGQTLYSAIGQSMSQALLIVVSGLLYSHLHQYLFWVMTVLVLPVFYLIRLSKKQRDALAPVDSVVPVH